MLQNLIHIVARILRVVWLLIIWIGGANVMANLDKAPERFHGLLFQFFPLIFVIWLVVFFAGFWAIGKIGIATMGLAARLQQRWRY